LTGSWASCGVTQLVETLGGDGLRLTSLVSLSCQKPGWISLAA
jgi:hypothetical protein